MLKRRDHVGYLDVDGEVAVKCILNKCSSRVCTGGLL
jgi:hypothetical protein